MVRRSAQKNKGMFRKNETLRVVAGEEGLVVVALCQWQN